MLQSSEEAVRSLAEGQSLLGPGWTHVNDFDDINGDEDEDEYEEESEEIYVTMDLGTTIDNKSLQNESQYQLIGLDTPLPFLKLGNQIFQGQVTPLIGDEVILGLVRDSDNPHEPSHPPMYSTNHRLTFQAVILEPRARTGTSTNPTDEPEAPANSAVPAPIPPHSQSDIDGNTNDQISSNQAVIEAGPSTSTSIHPFFSRATADPTGSASDDVGSNTASSAPKARVPRARVVIETREDLEKFDLDSVKTSQKVELGPEVLRALDLPPSTHGESVLLTKTELSKVISGFPLSVGTGTLRGQSGGSPSKSRRSTKNWVVGEDGRLKFQRPTTNAIVKDTIDPQQRSQGNSVLGDGDVEMQEPDSETRETRSSVVQHTERSGSNQEGILREDQEMADVEDDPPWAEMGEGGSSNPA
ncbi:uncharacterized protein I303_105375 [Kwoniella dejecticola CBS 10117]|uniref:Transcription factor TFIIIC triple barrel domain-containing protein n=1 Tax=Kwoniella dejecticola CBS 10117 TaxID=1296121 RepID=A0A1A6A2P0_9TREE|nr:uncharacterized protein I303_05179 [Kwoniella dejecticola CBS 10117]OBR84321.1 hypothetical protein I303_05179 [Kwoniella dejecticola CBS 10117]